MSEAAGAFQVSQGGRAGQAYLLNGVHFDAYANGALIEAKGSYAQFVKNGEFASWFTGKAGLVDQATRQLNAAGNTPVVWRVADAATQKAIQKAFGDAGIKGVKVELAKHACLGSRIEKSGPC